MPPVTHYECDNFKNCGKYVAKPGLCDDCKQEARELDKALRDEQRLIRLNTVQKNEGLRRHS